MSTYLDLHLGQDGVEKQRTLADVARDIETLRRLLASGKILGDDYSRSIARLHGEREGLGYKESPYVQEWKDEQAKKRAEAATILTMQRPPTPDRKIAA